jgi:hypothetical protein
MPQLPGLDVLRRTSICRQGARSWPGQRLAARYPDPGGNSHTGPAIDHDAHQRRSSPALERRPSIDRGSRRKGDESLTRHGARSHTDPWSRRSPSESVNSLDSRQPQPPCQRAPSRYVDATGRKPKSPWARAHRLGFRRVYRRSQVRATLQSASVVRTLFLLEVRRALCRLQLVGHESTTPWIDPRGKRLGSPSQSVSRDRLRFTAESICFETQFSSPPIQSVARPEVDQ